MINLIQRILHLIPLVHFYDKWSSTEECSRFGYDERQQRFCVICNKKQYRTVNSSTFFDK